jgi:hypothetical protein
MDHRTIRQGVKKGMKTKLVFLPLDDRPVNYDYSKYLARIANLELHLPPREWLGNPWRASQHERLVTWVSHEAENADQLIVAIDTLAYGGLVPSRTSPESLQKVLDRLKVLRGIKKNRPDLPILASSVIQRISRANSSEEEKDYWGIYGSTMFRLSYIEHKVSLEEASLVEKKECTILRQEIPDWVYQDYRQRRSRNHAVNQCMVDWLADDLFDYLLLPQDDTADYGWNIAEARALQMRIRVEGLSDKAITYPGADEIGCLLIVSSICHQHNFKPRVWPRYSAVNSPGVITAYEDRPIHELLKAHLAPLGGSIADSLENADLQLFINAPSLVQGEGMYQWLVWRGLDQLQQESPKSVGLYLDKVANEPLYKKTRQEMQTPQRNPEEFVRALLDEIEKGHPVALADVAFVNGADLILGNQLTQHAEIGKLFSYGGWNTAGNTLGTVLAQSVLRLVSLQSGENPLSTQAHLEFLFLRWLDDYYY